MKKFNAGGAPQYTMDVTYDPSPSGGFSRLDRRSDVYAGSPGTLSVGEMEQEANLRADILAELSEPLLTPEEKARREAAAKAEQEQNLLEEIANAQADLERTYATKPETGSLDDYFDRVGKQRDYLRSLTQRARDAGLKVPGTGFFDSVGQVLSRASDYTGIPLPDLVTGGPGGLTGVWGTPSGTPVGTKAVPRTAGSTYSGGPMRAGVLTGIPAIDILLSKSSQEGGFFEIPDIEDIGEILRGGGAPAPGTQTFTGDTTGNDKKTKFGVDGKTPIDDSKTPIDDSKTPTDDDAKTPIDDKTPTGGGDKTPTPPGGNLNETPTGGSDETPADDETPAGEGAGGAGYGQGIGVTTGAPGPTVDIDYLYDIAGSSIFNPAMGKTEEKDEEKNKRGPYVYANMGGMIRNNYDLTDEILRLLRRRHG